MALKILRRGVPAVVPYITIKSAPGAATAAHLIDGSGQTLDKNAYAGNTGSSVNIFSFKDAAGVTQYIRHHTGSGTVLSVGSSLTLW
jgi:hypothetical protein